MEILILILIILTTSLYLKVKKLEKHLTVLSFSEKLINKLLVKKSFVLPSEIDIITNEAIGEMYEDEGNKIISCAKSIGIAIPKYMDEEQLNKYVEAQEFKRRNSQIPYTDRMIMEE